MLARTGDNQNDSLFLLNVTDWQLWRYHINERRRAAAVIYVLTHTCINIDCLNAFESINKLVTVFYYDIQGIPCKLTCL